MAKKRPKAKKTVYYAVMGGGATGVYTDRKQFADKVKDSRNVRVRKWASYIEAKECLKHPELFTMPMSEILKSRERIVFSENNFSAYAYVDGSFNKKTNVYGYGGFIDVSGRRYVLSGSQNDKKYVSMGSSAGEIMGAIAVLEKVKELGLDEILIHHDAMVLQDWLKPACKNKTEICSRYRELVNSLAHDGVTLRFNHVKSHVPVKEAALFSNTFSQNRGMDVADRLAKEAVGIVKQRPLPRSFFNVNKAYLEPEFELYEPEFE